MRKLTALLMVAMFVCVICPAQGMTPYQSDEELKTGARQGFEQILDLWRDGKYGEVYERTISSGKETKEHFISRLSSAPLRPACCWEKMQDVTISVKKENTVVVHARIGLEGGVAHEYKTRSFKLVNEDGIWKISQSEIINLSGATKKKKRYVRWK
jgi:hypothetical protein